MIKKAVRAVRRRNILSVVTLLTVVALLGIVMTAAKAVWYGTPYPVADPDAVEQRLWDRSQWTYDGFGLPGTTKVDPTSMSTGSCYYRGLRSLGHIDEADLDVASFELSWNVEDITLAQARAAQKRLRKQLVAQDWKLTHEWDRDSATFVQLGFRFEDPKGDQIDVSWNTATTTLFVSVYAPCGRVPSGFRRTEYIRADWAPRGSSISP